MDFFTKWLKRFPRAFFYAFAVAAATLLGGSVPDLLGYAERYWNLPGNSLLIWQFLATFSGIALAIVMTRTGLNKRIDARVYSIGVADSTSAKRGLILLISSKSSNPTAEEIRLGYEAAFDGGDPITWGAPVKAILAHQSRLEHIWLISTTDSVFAATQLAEVTKKRRSGMNVHYENKYTVTGDAQNDAAIELTQKIANTIFEEANALGIPNRMLVADITGTTKPMTLGLAFACLDSTRDIQYTNATVQMFGFETRVDA